MGQRLRPEDAKDSSLWLLSPNVFALIILTSVAWLLIVKKTLILALASLSYGLMGCLNEPDSCLHATLAVWYRELGHGRTGRPF